MPALKVHPAALATLELLCLEELRWAKIKEEQTSGFKANGGFRRSNCSFKVPSKKQMEPFAALLMARRDEGLEMEQPACF